MGAGVVFRENAACLARRSGILSKLKRRASTTRQGPEMARKGPLLRHP
jgi:hypothetical protein